MDATHLHCTRCGTMRPIRFEPLLRGEASMGTSVCCARCSHHAFTLLRPARFYCEICDTLQPGLLEPMETGENHELGVLLVCSGCFDGKAMLYASPTPSRYAGAAASDRPPPGQSADRARRG